MNQIKCWHCSKEFEYDGEQYWDIDCPGCGVLNSIYNPADSIPMEEEGEEKMIEDVKLPFIKGEDLKTGDVAVIKSAFERKGKFNKYSANVKMGDTMGQLTLNDTSIGILVARWGNDPEQWIGKEISLSFENMANRENVRIWRPAEEE
jgi:phage FluMu protein Com